MFGEQLQQVNTVAFQPVLVFGTVSVIYFALCWPMSLFAAHLERRFAVAVVRKADPPLVLAVI